MNRHQKTCRTVMTALLALTALALTSAAARFVPSILRADEPNSDEAFLQALYADWEKQEGRLHRDCGHPMAVNALVFRAERLYENLTADGAIDEEGAEALRRAIDEARSVNTLPNESDLWTPNGPARDIRIDLYRKLRLAMRRAIFSSAPLAGRQIVFLKGNRYGFQLLQDYLSYYMRFSNIHGGGLFILKIRGISFETIELTKDFPMGQFATPNLSFDANTL
ncbi:MAG: hypothetical protein J6S75_02470, partial [Thermoguttaceae bacterium]|nr:hypothetical protein [Thermoguttaceae bacterium]